MVAIKKYSSRSISQTGTKRPMLRSSKYTGRSRPSPLSVKKRLTFLRKFFPKVTEILDATHPVTVVVTKDDQVNGHKMEGTECALAVACKRQKGVTGVIIGLSVSYLIRGKVATKYLNSTGVSREITSFDRHQDFSPGEYLLSTPSPSQRFGARRHRKSGENTGTGKKRSARHFTTRVRKTYVVT